MASHQQSARLISMLVAGPRLKELQAFALPAGHFSGLKLESHWVPTAAAQSWSVVAVRALMTAHEQKAGLIPMLILGARSKVPQTGSQWFPPNNY